MKPGKLSKAARYVPVIDGRVSLKSGVFDTREEAKAHARISVDMGLGKTAGVAPVWVAWRDRT